MRRQLHDAPVVVRREVGVAPPAELLVERLRADDVGNAEHHADVAQPMLIAAAAAGKSSEAETHCWPRTVRAWAEGIFHWTPADLLNILLLPIALSYGA